MCKDIKTLDLAKKNITLSINCLRKYADLITSLENLKSNFQNKNYKNSAENMKTILELSTFFKPYADIPQIDTTLRDKDKILNSLKLQLKDEFILFFKNFSDMTPQKFYQGNCLTIRLHFGRGHRKRIQKRHNIHLHSKRLDSLQGIIRPKRPADVG